MEASAHRLTELIYAAMLGETSWQTFLNELAAWVPNGKTVMVMHDEAEGCGHIPLASGVEPGILKQYSDYYASVNPFIAPASTRPNGSGVIDEVLVPRAKLRRTEFYNDFLAPYEMPSRVSLTIEHEKSEMFILALLSNAMSLEDKHQVARLLTALSPHLQRASRFYRQGAPMHLTGVCGKRIFDMLDIGMLVVGEQSRIKAASNRAEQRLSSGNHFSVSPLGRLVVHDSDMQHALHGMLSRWYSGPVSHNYRFTDTSITLIRLVEDDICFYFEGPTVAIVIEDSFRLNSRHIDLERFSSLFHLTQAEARSLRGIIDGKSTGDIARESVRSEETIRSQLKSLFRKTGARGREGILRKLLEFRH